MKCSDFLAVIHDYIDGEADRQTEKHIKEHLAKCGNCRKALKEMETLKQSVARAGEIPVPDDMAENVLSAIQKEIAGSKFRFRLPSFLTSWSTYVAIAACLVLFVVLKDSYQKQYEAYIYSAQNGAVSVSETGALAKSRMAPDDDGLASSENASPFQPLASLTKQSITFKVSDREAESAFHGAKAEGTDAVILALTEKGYQYTIEHAVLKDYTAEYNKLAAEADALYSRFASGDQNAAIALSQKEAQLETLKNDCGKPELKLVVTKTKP